MCLRQSASIGEGVILMKWTYLFLGVAVQAFVTSWNFDKSSSYQQFLVGSICFGASIALWLIEWANKKIMDSVNEHYLEKFKK